MLLVRCCYLDAVHPVLSNCVLLLFYRDTWTAFITSFDVNYVQHF